MIISRWPTSLIWSQSPGFEVVLQSVVIVNQYETPQYRYRVSSRSLHVGESVIHSPSKQWVVKKYVLCENDIALSSMRWKCPFYAIKYVD